jgi:hypothetical protein
MIRRSFGLMAAILLGACTAGCAAAGTNSAAPTRPAHSTTTTSLVTFEAGGATVAPSTDLEDAQQVTVSVKGFLPNRKFYLSECLTPTELNALGCGAQLAAQPFGLTDANGTGSTTFTVHSAASTGALIPTVQACTGECVIVATAGFNGALYFAPITFAPPTIPAASTPPCDNSHITVSDSGGGAALGHEDQVLVFTNDGHSVCTLTGYPGVAGLNPSGAQVVQASRTLSGYLRGLLPGATALPVVSLAPGQTASALAEGTDNPTGPQPCPHYPALLVTPPGLTEQVQVQVSDLSTQGFPGCSGVEVHPVVPGSSGASPGF